MKIFKSIDISILEKRKHPKQTINSALLNTPASCIVDRALEISVSNYTALGLNSCREFCVRAVGGAVPGEA